MKVEVDMPDPPEGSVQAGWLVVQLWLSQDEQGSSTGVTFYHSGLGPMEFLGGLEMAKSEYARSSRRGDL